ncbi:MAG: aldo/keto reductase [Candidatus Dojkabacteria bacterium]|nr:MAG: aldo/keto reductase [Candidatus Dojkabacteria bacterium]
MHTEQILKETLGLTDYQTLVYLSLIEKSATAGQLFRRLNINRATLYRILEELVTLSLAIRKQIKSRMYFEALHPDALMDLYEKRRISYEEKGRLLERTVHELLHKAQSQPLDASITIEKGISAHYKKMRLKMSCKEKIIRMKVNNDSNIYDYTEYPEGKDYLSFLSKFTKHCAENDIFTKLLVHTNLSTSMRDVNISNPFELKESRILPAEILPTVSFEVFDDYTIFTVRNDKPEEMVVITIRNQITADLMKSLYDFIFERSIQTYKDSPVPTFKTNGNANLPLIGIGTSGIGGYWYGANPYVDDTSDVDKLRHAMSKGIRYIDACLMYADGHAVELIAKAIKNIARSDLFINGKLTRVGGIPLKNAREIAEQCDQYLKKLGIDYLDQFQIHSLRTLGDVPQEEAIEQIGNLITAGKVRYWGVSNYDMENLKIAMSVIKEPIHSNEIPFGVFAREYEKNGTLDFMRTHGITTIAYFTVKKGGMLVDTFFNSDEDSILQQLAKKYQKTPTQIAINWVTHHPRTMAVIKATNGTHINENVAAVGWKMEEADYRAIGET